MFVYRDLAYSLPWKISSSSTARFCSPFLGSSQNKRQEYKDYRRNCSADCHMKQFSSSNKTPFVFVLLPSFTSTCLRSKSRDARGGGKREKIVRSLVVTQGCVFPFKSYQSDSRGIHFFSMQWTLSPKSLCCQPALDSALFIFYPTLPDVQSWRTGYISNWIFSFGGLSRTFWAWPFFALTA